MLRYLSKVWYILKGSRRKLPLLISVFIFSSVLEAFGIGLIGPFLNLASEPELIYDIPLLNRIFLQLNVQSSSQLISVFGLVIAGIFCIKSILYFFAQSYVFKFCFGQKANLASRLLTNYLAVPYTFYLSRNTASLIKNITYETMHINHACFLPLLSASANITIIIFLLALLAKTNLMLINLILIITLPTFLLFYKFKTSLRRWGKDSSEANQEIIRVINHGLGGLKETRIIGCEEYFQQQMNREVQKYTDSVTKCHSFNILPRIIIETFLIVFTLLFISISQLFFQQSVQDVTSIMAIFAVASIRLIPAVSQTLQAMGNLQNGSHSVNVIYSDLKELAQEEQQDEEQLNISSLTQPLVQGVSKYNFNFVNKIELENIFYSYPDSSESSINDISLNIKKGESIALIGKSGAGKTTLVDIILGLLIPQKGDIKVDNLSVYKNIRYWQNLIAYIPQSIFLMDDTIERNIAFGVADDLIDSEKIHDAIKAAQLEDLITQLPYGVKTSVGERGVRLSGGQRQRIGIARAIYHEREILVLDEATSALDNETEQLVSKAINSLAGKKTLIIIAHRLSTVENCDRIYLLDRGSVIKSGSYDEVVSKMENKPA